MTSVRHLHRRTAHGAAAPAEAPVVALPERATRTSRRLRLAAARPEQRSPLGILGSVLLVLLFAAVFGIVVFQALLVQVQSRLDALDSQIVNEEQVADRLYLDLVHLESPERVVAEAADRLGMVAPTEVLYLRHEPTDDDAARLDGGGGEHTGTAEMSLQHADPAGGDIAASHVLGGGR